MRREKYRGAEVVVMAVPLRDEVAWRARINLEMHTGNEVIVTPMVESPEKYSSEDAALKDGLERGKRMIDHRIDGDDNDHGRPY